MSAHEWQVVAPASGLPAREANLLAAFASAHESLSGLQAELTHTIDDLTSKPLLSEDERKALEEQGASGELGKEMQELVTAIRAGEDTWPAVFAGDSPRAALMTAHLTKQLAENIDDIALAFEDLLDAEEAKGNFVLDEVPGNQ